ncbi:PspC domain-containing protein [Marinilongibacter aquaticus]|uniref:PspC domain-containing protein n=1 Tax=Marinilongibacter aquaticus TaxID=2975157 RepID=UPI0021BDB3CC|nr:PspC domain-containing protein [Marinilongibacter aquaticus]UBM60415.1 PspC domain-containing protein [Marinilongibacter aquaticus]
MKKTIQINIAGQVFNIEEDAYQILKDYLESIQKYFSNYEGSEEIVADIEARIAEKFIGKNKPEGIPVITLHEVEQIMESMGGVADFEAIEEEAAFGFEPQEKTEATTEKQQAQAEEPQTESPKKKKVYRDTQRKLLGGVLAGLASYFNTDVVWLRFLFMVVFLGITPLTETALSGVFFLAYIICWISFPANDQLEEQKNIKKFYRDPENKVVGGVASGLSKYLNIDVAIMRLIFVVGILFFGVGLISYLIMWVVSPSADSLTQKMEMKGQAVTLENIDSQIKKKMSGETSEGSKKESALATILLLPFRIFGQLFQGIGRALSHLGPFFRVMLGVLLALAGLSMVIGSLSATGAFFGFMSGHQWFLDGMNVGNFTRDVPISTGFFIFLATAIPSIATLLAGIILISNQTIGSRSFWLTTLGLWIIGIVGSAIIGGKFAMNFAKKSSIVQNQHVQSPGSVLYLDTFQNLDSETSNINLSVYIEESDRNEIELVKEIQSSGSSYKDAKENASKVSYEIVQRDSVLIFNEKPELDEDASFRERRVTISLKVPEGQQIRMSKNFARRLLSNNWSLKSKYGLEDEDFEKLTFTMEKDGDLSCNTCDALDEEEQKAYRERDNRWSEYYLNDDDFKPRGEYKRVLDVNDFKTLDINGAFRVLVSQGDEYNVEVVAENEKDLEDLSVHVRNGSLYTGFRDRFYNNRGRVNIFITMPTIEAIESSGATKMKVLDFRNLNEVDLDFAGASNAQLDIDANEVSLEGSGASKVEIRGHIKQMEIDLSGASEFIGDNADIERAKVDASGASHALMGHVGSLNSSTSGASRVERD